MINLEKTNAVNETEEKVSKSLERKTKKELIEIILRKDSVERNLRADAKGMENKLNYLSNELENANHVNDNLVIENRKLRGLYDKANDSINSTLKDINVLRNDYEGVCDELVDTQCKFKNYKRKGYWTGLIICIFIIVELMLLLMSI